jgi:hypothetical protein
MLVKVLLPNSEFKATPMDAVTVHVSTVSQPMLQPVGYVLISPDYQILNTNTNNPKPIETRHPYTYQ